MFTHSTGAGDPADSGGESAFDYSDSGTYTAMDCNGLSCTLNQFLSCDVTRYYSFACWDASANVSSFGAGTRTSITTGSQESPPSASKTVTIGGGGHIISIGGGDKAITLGE